MADAVKGFKASFVETFAALLADRFYNHQEVSPAVYAKQRDEEYATARRDGCRDGMMGFEYDSRTSKAAIKTMRVYANAWASAEAVCVDLRLRRRLPYLLCRQRYRELPLSERASGDILLKIAGASATTFPTKVLHKVLKYV